MCICALKFLSRQCQRTVSPQKSTNIGDEEDLWNQVTKNKKDVRKNDVGGSIGGGNVEMYSDTTRGTTAAGNATPAFLKRQNSATKIQSMARMEESKKKVKKVKEERKTLVPEVGDHHVVDRSMVLKRQNSATKIQTMARMKKGKEKVKTIREQRRVTVI